MKIPFNKPYIIGTEIERIQEVIELRTLQGGGKYSKICESYLTNKFHLEKAFLTPSCTDALELAGLLLNLSVGDEVIMPSFTFTSTANSLLLRGVSIKFVDIDPKTQNICPKEIEKAITKNTKAIVVVHYAGISCKMDEILKIASEYHIEVIEDAAQAMNSKYKDKFLGSIGDIGAFSFHETKNYIAGEGGAILLRDNKFLKRVQTIRDKGTNRIDFLNGDVDKYYWVDIGGSYLPSELASAFLSVQLENSDFITKKRLEIWNRYFDGLRDISELVLPHVPDYCTHNAHIFYILVQNDEVKEKLRIYLGQLGIQAQIHFYPLHMSPMGKKINIGHSVLQNTEKIFKQLLRLPLYPDLEFDEVDYVVESIRGFFKKEMK